MKITISKPNEKTRAVIVCFAVFIALMLFQTSYMNLGTITAAAAILSTMAALFLRGGHIHSKLKLSTPYVFLLLFLFYSILLMIVNGHKPSYLLPYVSQILLCLVLSTITLRDHEHTLLKTVFAIASTVYAILIIKSLYENRVDGYYHTDVLIFNTSFDPNFIGIPLTAAMALLLDNVLHKKHTILSVFMYAIITFAVLYTASRGSFVAAIVSNGLVLCMFLVKADLPMHKKVWYLILPVIACSVVIILVKEFLPNQWERLGQIGLNQGGGRYVLWRRAINDWLTSPIFGHGLGYAYKTYRYVTHNTYLQILSETGLVGFALLLMFFIPILKKARKADTSIFCMMIGISVQIFFLDALDNRCLWILLCWVAMLPSFNKGTEYDKKSGNTSAAVLQEKGS